MAESDAQVSQNRPTGQAPGGRGRHVRLGQV